MSPGDKQFVCPLGDKKFSYTAGGDKHFSHTGGGDKHFFVGGGVAYDDVDEEMVVSEANIFVSEVSMLSAGARIFRGL